MPRILMCLLVCCCLGWAATDAPQPQSARVRSPSQLREQATRLRRNAATAQDKATVTLVRADRMTKDLREGEQALTDLGSNPVFAAALADIKADEERLNALASRLRAAAKALADAAAKEQAAAQELEKRAAELEKPTAPQPVVTAKVPVPPAAKPGPTPPKK